MPSVRISAEREALYGLEMGKRMGEAEHIENTDYDQVLHLRVAFPLPCLLRGVARDLHKSLNIGSSSCT